MPELVYDPISMIYIDFSVMRRPQRSVDTRAAGFKFAFANATPAVPAPEVLVSERMEPGTQCWVEGYAIPNRVRLGSAPSDPRPLSDLQDRCERA